jgi:hypothetical protein
MPRYFSQCRSHEGLVHNFTLADQLPFLFVASNLHFGVLVRHGRPRIQSGSIFGGPGLKHASRIENKISQLMQVHWLPIKAHTIDPTSDAIKRVPAKIY